MNKELTDQQKQILLEQGTEKPFTGEFVNHFEDGSYSCVGCDSILFSSDSKYKTTCGWPSFDSAVPGSTKEISDTSLSMKRIEVVCAKCGGHLGHKFPDGPKETTGVRYCINSAILDFKDKE